MSTRSRTTSHTAGADARGRAAHDAWYRQGIVWIGAAVLAASVAGCIWLLVAAERYADPPLNGTGLQILKMPLARQTQPPRAETPPP